MANTHALILESYQSWLNTISNDKEYRKSRVYGILDTNAVPVASRVQVFKVDEDNEQKGQVSSDLMASIGVGAAALGGGAAVVAVAPTVITALGFTSSGIVGGSVAASIMSTEAILAGGGVSSLGLTAALQSAGAVGMGLGFATGIFAVGAIGAYGISRAFKSKPKQRIGYLVGPAFLTDGNVVALYSPEQKRFLSLTKDKKVNGYGGRGGKISYNMLSTENDSECFLVVGNVSENADEVALYSISHKCFLKVDGGGDTLVGGCHSIENGHPSKEEVFQVKTSENGQINLFSPLFKNHVCMHPNGDVDCGARHDAMAWENFIVVLITAVKTADEGLAKNMMSSL